MITKLKQPSYGAVAKSWKQGEKFVVRRVYNADYSNVHEITGVVLADCEYPGSACVEYYDLKAKKLVTELVPVANLFPMMPPEDVPVIDYGDTDSFQVGDRVKVKNGIELFLGRFGIVTAGVTPLMEQYGMIAVLLDGDTYPFGIKSVDLEAAPLEKDYGIAVGDRVTFAQVWNGEIHQFVGIVQKLNEPPGTALVQYEVPKHLQDGVDRPNILQSPIALFSLANALPPEPAYSFGTSEFPGLPPESDDNRISSEINRLRSQGTVAPAGVWVECCKVSHSEFRQAYWRSREPCFTPIKGNNPEAKCRKRYIGKEGSNAHKAAIAQIDRRNKIQKLIKQLPKNLRESI
jgi:hypothetical protein